MDISKKMLDSIPFQYANDVLKGKIVTGQNVKLAVERFFTMIETDNDYFLDNNAGQKALNFFPTFLKHTKGKWAGTPFDLSPYQQFTYYNVFAWKRPDENGDPVRLIRTVYEKVARKNGKTAGLGGLGLYCQGCDDEEGPEIYVGATKEAQAKILWHQAYDFVFKGVELRRAGFKLMQREIKTPFNSGKFQFLGGDSQTQDGLNPSVSIIDEYHAHATDGVKGVLESAMGARQNPLSYIITTAGTNISSVCKSYEDVCLEILRGTKTDDSTFVMMHDLDADDDWENSEIWQKANPNLNVSVSMDYLNTQFLKAQNQPSTAPNFKTKHLNLWVDAPSVWIPNEIWQKNKISGIPMDKFSDFGSYAGLDLSSTTDITAYVALSNPDNDGNRFLKGYFFCPLATIELRSKRDRVPYREWMDAGHLIATPGDTIDYDYVEDKIKETAPVLNVIRIEIDQWNAAQVANNLAEAGIETSFFSQAIGNISFPTKQFEKLVYDGKILHDGNPIFTWMLAGCVIYRDANDNIKVHKGHSHGGVKRVDGIIGAIMALGGNLSIPETNKSKYNDLEIPDEDE